MEIHNNISCILCDTLIKRLYPDIPQTSPESDMWHSGSVFKIYPGYGSDHDTEIILMGICDVCLTDLESKNKIIKTGNYL